VKRWWDDTAGRLLLRLAAVLHRTVASDKANSRWLSRRDRAIRAARRRGVTVEELAERLELTTSWIRQVLAGKKAIEPPAVEEAA
jgi:transposase-like protein